MKYVRWKPYGFTHIVKGETEILGRGDEHFDGWTYARGKSLCGTNFSAIISVTGRHSELMQSYVGKVMAPTEEDDGKRPLCGSCRRIAKL